MTNNALLLENMVAVENLVEVGEGTKFQIERIETLREKVVADGRTQTIIVKDFLFVPSLTKTFLSVSCLR